MSSDVVERKPNPAYRVWRDVTPEVRQERLQMVLQRVVNDEKTEAIAKDLGISRSALNMALLEYAEDDWKKAQVARAQTRLDRARDIRERMAAILKVQPTQEEIEQGIACTTETLMLARDEEKSAQWELERLCRRIYGTDAPDKGSAGISIVINSNVPNAVQHGTIIDNNDTEAS